MLIKSLTLAVAMLLGVAAGLPAARADTAGEISSKVDGALRSFLTHVRGSNDLLMKARGVLVFPSVIKAGVGVGGEYGEGELRIGGASAGYFNTVSASIGFQLGVEQRTVIILFMTDEALRGFRQTKGWKVGVDGSVAIITVGAGASIDTNKIVQPVIGFILDPKGLMYNLTLEGSKISRIDR
jgi:lipid-binding SYLF domain-containing protein